MAVGRTPRPKLSGSQGLVNDDSHGGIITPAISVLSAAEGIEVAAPAFKHYVLPLTLLVLFLLFFCQRYGTGRMGGVFGPIMLGWFALIGTLGAMKIIHEPEILLALNPRYGIVLFAHHGVAAFLVLGGVVLVVTGAEALYADLGHFGRRPIRLGWFVVVLPALVLNYFGQGALLLRIPAAVENTGAAYIRLRWTVNTEEVHRLVLL